jgi:hypothetical protein
MTGTTLPVGQAAALHAVDNAEVSIHPDGYVNESHRQPSWTDGDMAAVVAAGYARHGRDHVSPISRSPRWATRSGRRYRLVPNARGSPHPPETDTDTRPAPPQETPMPAPDQPAALDREEIYTELRNASNAIDAGIDTVAYTDNTGNPDAVQLLADAVEIAEGALRRIRGLLPPGTAPSGQG